MFFVCCRPTWHTVLGVEQESPGSGPGPGHSVHPGGDRRKTQINVGEMGNSKKKLSDIKICTVKMVTLEVEMSFNQCTPLEFKSERM